MHETVESVLERVRPCLRVDGGDIELVSFEGGVVTLRLVGGFSGCPMSQIALHCGLEHALTQQVEGVQKVVVLRGAGAGAKATAG
jgi:Fe-S cluster biogenesis protein NfuA